MIMKRIVFTVCCILTLIGVTGCYNENENVIQSSQETSVTLIAPNGEIIAKDISALRNETALIVAKQFGDDFKFSVTSIEYITVNKGYLALISYELEDGRQSNYVKTNCSEVINSSSLDSFHIKSASQRWDWKSENEKIVLSTVTKGVNSTSEVSFVCKSATNCKPCQVKVSQYQDSVNDEVSTKVSCSDTCSDCKLEATIKE